MELNILHAKSRKAEMQRGENMSSMTLSESIMETPGVDLLSPSLVKGTP